MRGHTNSILEGLLDDRNQLTEKRIEYLRYIKDHVGNVVKAYNEYMIPLLNSTKDSELREAILKAGKNVQYHDMSKYEPIEFEAYRMYWYPTDSEKKDSDFEKVVKSRYDVATEHHYKNNPHHTNYWIHNGKPKDMPLEYIIEMICDWLAMGMFYHSSTIDWYKNKADEEKSEMSSHTKSWVEDLIYKLIPNIP